MINIIDYLQSIGCHTVDSSYRAEIDTWVNWYRGYVSKVHQYSVYNGVKYVRVTRQSLGMGKTVSEDWANLLLNERVLITAACPAVQAQLDAALAANNFTTMGNRLVEIAFATGTGAFSEYLDTQGRPVMDCHDARAIWPLAWSGGRITECAFSSVEVMDDKKCIYLRLYRLDPDGTQRIENHYLDYESGKPVAPPAAIVPIVHTGIAVPLFQIVTPNLANNISVSCPMGISVYSTALDVLRSVDIAFDSLFNEFNLGRKRVMIPMSMARIEDTAGGAPRPVFDPTDTVFYAFEPLSDDGEKFHDLSPELRIDAHKTGIQLYLDMLSYKCGLGTGRYNFEVGGQVKTATEVVSEQSDLYQSLCKHELVLSSALQSLAAALLCLSGAQTRPDEITITFDDSIIQDRSAIRAEARDEVAAGLMSKRRYLIDIVGMSEADADSELALIRAEGSITAEAADFFALRGADET